MPSKIEIEANIADTMEVVSRLKYELEKEESKLSELRSMIEAPLDVKPKPKVVKAAKKVKKGKAKIN